MVSKVERIELTAQGSEIHGVAYFTARQLGEIIDFAPLLIGSRQRRPRPTRSDAGTVPNTTSKTNEPSSPSPAPAASE